MKIESASDNNIEKYQQYVSKILKAVNHQEAYVTDESIFWDFCPSHLTRSGQKRWVEHLGKMLGTKIGLNEFIWQAACRLCEADKDGQIK